MVAGGRWTGTAERRAPPVIKNTPTRARTTPAGRPIVSQRGTRPRGGGAAEADSDDRLMRRAARSAFFASMPTILTVIRRVLKGTWRIKNPTHRHGSSGGGASGARRLRRWTAQYGTARGAGFLARRALGRRGGGRGWGRWHRWQGLTRDHQLDILAIQGLALEQRRGQAIERVAALDEHRSGPLVRIAENALHLGIDQLGRALGDLAPLHDLAPEEDLGLPVADGNRADRVA